MFVRLFTDSAAPVTVGDVTVTCKSQALVVCLPFARLVWNRPTGVVVERDGYTQQVPVVDMGRLLQFGFYGLAAAVWVGTLVAATRRGAARAV